MFLMTFSKALAFLIICLLMQIAIIALFEWTHDFDLLIMLLTIVTLGFAFLVSLIFSIFYCFRKQWHKLFIAIMLPLSVLIIYFSYYPIKNNLERVHYRMVFNLRKSDYQKVINKLIANQPRFKIFYLSGYGQLGINTDIYVVYDEKDDIKKIGSPTWERVSKKLSGGICDVDSVREHFYIVYSCTY
jgi:predicted membrane protein